MEIWREKMKVDRFEYRENLQRASSYKKYRSALWPPLKRYALFGLQLSESIPELSAEAIAALDTLRIIVEKEWQLEKAEGSKKERKYQDAIGAAAAMFEFSKHLPNEIDKRAVELRATALMEGYSDSALIELKNIQEDIALVVGRISTWYGKQVGGLPTAFACRCNFEKQDKVLQAMACTLEISQYLKTLHTDLILGELPAFTASNVFYMVGEGNLHPKHIAYFLPEDEGVKRSPFKKTYYFSNTHNELVQHFSIPLAQKYLDIGTQFNPNEGESHLIPTIGVLAHEMGHFVHRPSTQFGPINEKDRWASVTLQEIAADVFGTLISAEVLSQKLDFVKDQVLAYYLSECLRYIDRGLGFFPDSDGMYLQISYLIQVGALSLQKTPFGQPILVGETGAILAGLRSMARVLADALLADDPDFATEFYLRYGPENSGPLKTLVDDLAGTPFRSIEYLQDY